MVDKDIMTKINGLCKEIECLIRTNQPTCSVDYFEQKALLELYLNAYNFMHYMTLKSLGAL